MAGCGGNCQCRAQREAQQNGPRDAVTLSEALAKVIIDNRIVRYAVEFSRRHPEATVDDIVAAVNDAKITGEL